MRPSNPLPGEAVRFSSTAQDADGTVVEWRWELGDGTSHVARAVGGEAFNAPSAEGGLPPTMKTLDGAWAQRSRELEGTGSFARVALQGAMPHDFTWTVRARVLHAPELPHRTIYFLVNGSDVMFNLQTTGTMNVGYRVDGKETWRSAPSVANPLEWTKYTMTITGSRATFTVNDDATVSIESPVISLAKGSLAARVHTTQAAGLARFDDWYVFEAGTSTNPPDHAYAAAGTYPVRLALTDNEGTKGTAALDLQVFEKVATRILDDFETATWSGFVPSNLHARDGARSAKWAGAVPAVTRLLAGWEADWSRFEALEFWLHSEKAVWKPDGTGALQLIVNSENVATPGADYFSREIRVDWAGWKHFRVAKADLLPTRAPRGWGSLDNIAITATGWGHTQAPDMVLHMDRLLLTNPTTRVEAPLVDRSGLIGGDVRLLFKVTNVGSVAESVSILGDALESGAQTRVEPSSFVLSPAESRFVTLTAGLPARLVAGDLVDLALVARATGAGYDGIAVGRARAVEAPAATRDHPALYVDESELDAARRRAETEAWARAALDRIVLRADAIVAEDPKVVVAPAQWTLYYVCPDGTPLRYDRKEPHRHFCPSTGETITGNPLLDAAWLGARHQELAEYAWTSALAYQLTGKEEHAGVAQRILLGFADAYSNLDYHDRFWGKGKGGARVFSQTLDESAWLVRLAGAYDLLLDRLAPEERANVHWNLLDEAVRTIRRNDMGTSNWQTWHNAAIAAAGYASDRPDLQALALDGPSGVRYQLEHSILADGFWWELSNAYHFYALDALLWTALAADHGGVALFDEEVGGRGIEAMFRMPVLLAAHNLVIPALNDGPPTMLPRSAYAFELANARYDDATFDFVLAYAYGPGGMKRDNPFALLYGKDYDPALDDPRGSVVLEASGLGVLRTERTYAVLDFGPHGGAHGHEDKLSLATAHTDYPETQGFVLPDPGTVSYSLPAYTGYFRRSLAHNTLLVDGRTQAPSTGALRAFHASGDAQILVAEADEAYASASLTRTLVATDDYLLDVSEARSRDGKAHSYDYVLHHGLPAQTSLNLTPRALPGDASYGYLSQVQGAVATGDFFAEWKRSLAVDDEFDDVSQWTNLQPDASVHRSGQGSGRWADTQVRTGISKPVPTDWGQFRVMSFWLHSAASTWKPDGTGGLQLLVFSENASTPGLDYYSVEIRVNWTGWKLFEIQRSDLLPTRSPSGWNRITGFAVSAVGWGHTPDPATLLHFDALRLHGDVLYESPRMEYGTRLHGLGFSGANTTVHLARAPNNPMTGTHPVLVERQEGVAGRFASVIETFAGAPRVLAAASVGDRVVIALASGAVDVVDLAALSHRRFAAPEDLPEALRDAVRSLPTAPDVARALGVAPPPSPVPADPGRAATPQALEAVPQVAGSVSPEGGFAALAARAGGTRFDASARVAPGGAASCVDAEAWHDRPPFSEIYPEWLPPLPPVPPPPPPFWPVPGGHLERGVEACGPGIPAPPAVGG